MKCVLTSSESNDTGRGCRTPSARCPPRILAAALLPSLSAALLSLCALSAPAAAAAEISVQTVEARRDAVAGAAPGDTIILAAGTAEAPIVLRGAAGATIESDTVEAIKIHGPSWRIEGLTMIGVCADDSGCEHAVHIVGAADGTEITGCALIDFNAQIKSNGEEVGGVFVWPDDVRISGNDLHDTRPRQTANPVTKIDVVGGRRWTVTANRISDYEKALGDTVSYGAFLKGNSQDGLMERNLVVCSERFSGGVRLGLSLGGGGTSPDSICEEGTCTPEHRRGTLQNNLIANCSDVGIYLNEAAESLILGNTLYQTSGIDVRYEASTAALTGNLLDGRIRERDGGAATPDANLEQLDLSAVFADPGALDFRLVSDPGIIDAAPPGLTDDFCGNLRDGSPDIGAVEYLTDAPCDTSRTHPDAPGGSGSDSGDSGADDSPPDGDSAGDSAGNGAGAGDSADPGKGGGCGCTVAASPGTASSGAAGLAGLAVWAWTRRREQDSGR